MHGSEEDVRQDFYMRLWLEGFTLIAILALTANILQIIVIAKFRKMRQNPTNVLILNLNIIQMIFFFSSQMFFRVLIDFKHLIQSFRFFYIMYAFHNVLSIAIMAFITLLLFDWYLKKYNELIYLKFINLYRFLVPSIYICTIFLITIESLYCLNPEVLIFMNIIPPLLFGLLFIMVIFFNVIHNVRVWQNGDNVTSSNGLAITNIFTVFWLPSTISSVVWFISFGSLYMYFLVYLTVIIGFLSPPLNLLYLYRNDNEFHIFFRRVFRCSSKDYQNETFYEQTVTFPANEVHVV